MNSKLFNKNKIMAIVSIDCKKKIERAVRRGVGNEALYSHS